MADIIFTDTLKCTATHGKLAKAEQIYDDTQGKSQETINSGLIGVTSCHVMLGTFESSGSAESKGATAEYAGNASIIFMHYSVNSSDSSRSGTGLIMQQVGGTQCFQTIFWGNTIKTRTITFTNAQRTSVSNVGGWTDFDPIVSVRNDSGGMANYGDIALLLYVTTIHGNSDKYITIPCVGYNGSTEHGLMIYSDKVALDKLKTYGYIATINSWSSLSKLTKNTTPDELVTALGMLDIDNDRTPINTIDGVRGILNKCQKNGFYLQEKSGTFSMVNVSYIGSTFYLSSIRATNVKEGDVWVVKPCMKVLGINETYDSSTQTHSLSVGYPVETYNLYSSNDIDSMKEDIKTIKQKLNLTE